MPEDLTSYRYKTSIPIRFSDIDAYGNVSNTIYLTYFEIARSGYWNDIIKWDWSKGGIILGKSEVNYLKPLAVNDVINCYTRVSRIGNSSFDMLYVLTRVSDTSEEICTTGKTVCISYDYQHNKSTPIPAAERRRMIEYDEPGLITNTN